MPVPEIRRRIDDIAADRQHEREPGQGPDETLLAGAIEQQDRRGIELRFVELDGDDDVREEQTEIIAAATAARIRSDISPSGDHARHAFAISTI